jgi:hypothetical protein
MKASTETTLRATGVAIAVGTGAYLFGFAQKIWPAHPLLAVLLVTVAATVIAKLWPTANRGL